MATAIMNMSGVPLPYPSHGRLRIRTITRATMPGSSVASFTLRDNWFEIHFNPLFHLSSREGAFSFFLGRLATLGVDIVYPIAMFAFDLVRSRNWSYGVSLSVDLETVYVLEEEPMRSADFLDGEMILNDDTAAVSEYYEQLDGFLFDLMLQPFGHGNVGMSEQEISMLRTERLSDDDDEDGECCSICLEEFTRGMVITELAPCSHRFHNACIAQWLRNNPTCPICRCRCTVCTLKWECPLVWFAESMGEDLTV
nr:E3 ubiquitin-protein ligase At4g11680-like [Ipomoea batatas]